METEPPDLSNGPPEGDVADVAAADALLLAMGRHERAQRAATDESPLSKPWGERLAGSLDADATREAARAAGIPDDEAERGEAYFRPYDEGEREHLVDALLTTVAAPTAEDEATTEADNVVPLARPSASENKAGESKADGPRHDPGSSPWWWIPGGMLAAAAAAIVAWMVWPPTQELLDAAGEDSGGGQVVAQATLPAYVLETDGGLKVVRGDDTGVAGDTSNDPDAGRHRYQQDTRFEWILRPKLETDGEVAVRGFAFAGETLGSGLPLALEQRTQISASGSIRISGTIADLGLEPGRYTIVLVVGRPEDLPQQAQEVQGDESDVWQARRIAIAIE